MSASQRHTAEEALSEVPLKARILLSHAHLQHLADTHGIDILHIKGYAFGTDTYPVDRQSTDVDVLVRPDHLGLFVTALKDAGWKVVTTFESGSDFHHAMTVYHPTWGLSDIHRYFPGLDASPEHVFDELWAHRRIKKLGGYECTTVSVVDARALVYVHAARSTSSVKPDVVHLDDVLSEAQMQLVQRRVQELNAELAFAAARGSLDDFSTHRDYLLWKSSSEQVPEYIRWKARLRSARGLRAKASTLRDIFFVNTDHLAMSLGREPTRQEVREKFFSRFSALTRIRGKKN